LFDLNDTSVCYDLASAYGSGYIVNFSDIMPTFSSVVFGISTAVGTCFALLGNLIAGLVIKQPVLEDWRKLFVLFSVMYFIGGLAFVFFGSAKPQSWATLKGREEQQKNDANIEDEAVPMQQKDEIEVVAQQK
jgi:hypothetical protein